MSKYYAVICRYFRKGLYTESHLAVLEGKGVITAEEREQILRG